MLVTRLKCGCEPHGHKCLVIEGGCGRCVKHCTCPRPFNAALWTIDRIIEDLQRTEPKAIPRALEWMKETGSSALLNWGEDDNTWECSWVTGGKRYTDHSANMTSAIIGSLLKRKGEL